MFCFLADVKTLDKTLRHLVRRGQNAKIKSILKAANPSDLIDCAHTPIVHLAAKYANLDLMEFLLTCGYDINERDSRGTTPLLLAVVESKFDMVKFLLDANADVFIPDADGKSPLKLLIDKKHAIPTSVTERLLRRLKCASRANADEVSTRLLEADCSLEFALRLENADVTTAMLQQTEEISIDRARDLLLIAMDSTYLDNVGALLHHGHKAIYRREKFLSNLAERIGGSAVELASARPFLRRLAEWNVTDLAFVEFLQQAFERFDRPALELLLECDVDGQVRRKFGGELLAHAFVNRHDGVIELLRERRFDVDARDKDGQAGLHIAATHRLASRMRFLLDRGANANVKDRHGRTPLLFAWDVECIEILLRAGADVQVVDYSGLTLFDKTNNLLDSMKLLLAHLAVIEARGVTIKRKICDRIDSRLEFKEFYDQCRAQLDWMSTRPIGHSSLITLFVAMIKKPEDLLCYVRDRRCVDEALRCARDHQLHSFYVATLQNNLNRILEINDGERNADARD